ncbi:MAG: hypothetical protein K0R54_1223 [Clostridiaceae bacterium]|jgi:hypothetical protein|nr:hypothetical protein [Clostridiaceae bacterium]
MRRLNHKYSILALMLIIVMLFPSCGSKEKSDAEAKKLISKFLTEFYQVDDYKKGENYINTLVLEYPNDSRTKEFKNMMTEDGFKDFTANRMSYIAIEYAVRGRCSINVTNITMKKYTSYDDGTVGYTYNAKLKLSFDTTKEQIVSDEEGQISVKEVNKEMKISMNNRLGTDFIETIGNKLKDINNIKPGNADMSKDGLEAIKGQWIGEKFFNTFNEHGGTSFTIENVQGSSFQGTISSISDGGKYTARAVIKGNFLNNEAKCSFQDDGWGHSGSVTLKIIDNKITADINITNTAEQGQLWGIQQGQIVFLKK